MGSDVVCASAAHANPVQKLRAPSVVGTMLFIGALKLALRSAGFARTWQWLRERAQRTPLCNDAVSADVLKAEYNVALAAALYPGRAMCLERSLTLYWYLRRRGVPVSYRMGVQMYPFVAHAWVEYHGQPINDVPEHVKRFRPIEGVAT